MKQHIPSADILRKYLANQCTEEERLLVDNWYRQMNIATTETFSSKDEQLLFQKILTQIADIEPVFVKPKSLITNLWFYASAAAAVFILIFGFYHFNTKHAVKLAVKQANQDSTAITYNNTQKKIIRYTLPDSSIVWLQPGAKLSCSAKFNHGKNRAVRFHGEGFFSVKRNVNRPFVIYSGELVTRVLGTSFNIKANENESTYQVSVVTGSVAVSSPNKKNKIETVVLKPKQQVVFEKANHAMMVNLLKEEKSHVESWQSVSLSFDETPMTEVARRLELAFQVRIEFLNPNIKNCRLKIDLNNQRLPEILEMLEILLNTSYEMNGNKITLTGEGCN